MQWVATMWLAYQVVALTSSWRGVPNEEVSVCVLFSEKGYKKRSLKWTLVTWSLKPLSPVPCSSPQLRWDASENVWFELEIALQSNSPKLLTLLSRLWSSLLLIHLFLLSTFMLWYTTLRTACLFSSFLELVMSCRWSSGHLWSQQSSTWL